MPDLRLVVRGVDDLTSAVRRLRLASATGGPLPLFTAGAHIKVKVTLPDGRQDERSYSLVNSDSQQGEYEIGVQREANGKGGSAFMHRLAAGDELVASEPVNDFPLAVGATRHILIAGGIGITPILSMARALRAAGQPYDFHYASRSRELMAFHDVVQTVCGDAARVCFDGGDPKNGLNLDQVIGNPDPGRHVYVCGPGGMIDAVVATAGRLGWPRSHVHLESFGAVAQASDGGIEVVLARTGRTFHVPAEVPILEVLLEAGIDVPHDCQRGECSSCQVEVLEGIPDNRDYCLFGPEYDAGKLMCVCVSRAKTPKLVLNL
jgi:vanillate O-demethylase ferredoxin subunit